MGEALSQHQQDTSPAVTHTGGGSCGSGAPAKGATSADTCGRGALGNAASGDGGGANSHTAWQSGEFCEPALLAQLVQLLGQRARHSLLLSDLGALLPGPLRHGVKEKGGLRSWLQKYPVLFQVSGQPGKESVTLLLGAGADAAAGAAAPADVGTGVAAGVGATAGIAGPKAGAVATADLRRKDDEEENEAAVQLRGLPYRAGVADIRRFLGAHVHFLKDESSVQLVLNRDGRPSGFARVQFCTPKAAAAARQDLHMRVMEVPSAGVCAGSSFGGLPSGGGSGHAGLDRYVEVFLYSERPNKLRFKKAPAECVANSAPGEGEEQMDALGITKEQVIQQCREHMNAPGQGQLLLSMLGVALSQAARVYLKKTDQGLKHFLSQYPNDFVVDGAKGREMITYLPAMGRSLQPASWSPTSAVQQKKAAANRRASEEAHTGAAHGNLMDFPGSGSLRAAMRGEDVLVPQSPKPTGMFGETPLTPSNWGTPQLEHMGDVTRLSAHRAGDPLTHRGGHVAQRLEGEHLGASMCAASEATATGAAPVAAYNNWSAWAVPPQTYWPSDMAADFWPPDVSAGQFPWGTGGVPEAIPSELREWARESPSEASGLASMMPATARVDPMGFLGAFGGPGAMPSLDMVSLFAAMGAAGGSSAAPGAPPLPRPEPATDFGAPPCAVRLRGLPFNAGEQDVMTFFAKYDMVERIAEDLDAVQMVMKASGKPSGQAVVKMLSRADAMEVVQALHGKYLGTRYIEVYEHKEGDSGGLTAPQLGGGTTRTPSAWLPEANATGSSGSPSFNEGGDTGGSGNIAGAVSARLAAQKQWWSVASGSHSLLSPCTTPGAMPCGESAVPQASDGSRGLDENGGPDSGWAALFSFLKQDVEPPSLPSAAAFSSVAASATPMGIPALQGQGVVPHTDATL